MNFKEVVSAVREDPSILKDVAVTLKDIVKDPQYRADAAAAKKVYKESLKVAFDAAVARADKEDFAVDVRTAENFTVNSNAATSWNFTQNNLR